MWLTPNGKEKLVDHLHPEKIACHCDQKRHHPQESQHDSDRRWQQIALQYSATELDIKLKHAAHATISTEMWNDCCHTPWKRDILSQRPTVLIPWDSYWGIIRNIWRGMLTRCALLTGQCSSSQVYGCHSGTQNEPGPHVLFIWFVKVKKLGVAILTAMPMQSLLQKTLSCTNKKVAPLHSHQLLEKGNKKIDWTECAGRGVGGHYFEEYTSSTLSDELNYFFYLTRIIYTCVFFQPTQSSKIHLLAFTALISG